MKGKLLSPAEEREYEKLFLSMESLEENTTDSLPEIKTLDRDSSGEPEQLTLL